MTFSFVSACAQTPVEKGPGQISVPVPGAGGGSSISASPRDAVPGGRARRTHQYRFEINAQGIDFSLLINGHPLLVEEGGKKTSSSVVINDWMISGANEVSINIDWPIAAKFSPGAASAAFALYMNETVLKEFRWPAQGVPDVEASYPHTITDTFKADGFPRTQIERAERVRYSMGIFPQNDQTEIASVIGELRLAFTEKNMPKIGDLFKAKYADLAAARFSSPSDIKGEMDAYFLELMEKEAYAVRPMSGRYSFSTTMDDKLVRVVMGRPATPEAALGITYREGRNSRRYDLDLYFAKIDGKWVIIR